MGSLGGYIGQILGHFGVTLGICRRLWMTFGSLWGHFGIMMRICGGLEGPKSENVGKVLVSKAFLKGSKEPRVIWSVHSRS